VRKSILIVEDDKEIRQTLIDILEGEGHKVLSAHNGQVALDILHSTEELPGLVILDLMMPVMDAYGFRKEQMKDEKLASVPTVLFSADGRLAQKAALGGFSEFIKKPAELDDLFALAEKYCVLAS
jgi:CheY-like chemotaxis protein